MNDLDDVTDGVQISSFTRVDLLNKGISGLEYYASNFEKVLIEDPQLRIKFDIWCQEMIDIGKNSQIKCSTEKF